MMYRTPARLCRLTCAIRPLIENLEPRQFLSVSEFVIGISVDGLRPDAITSRSATELPNFYRLRRESAFTDNARTDTDSTVTLPNHTSMLTGRPVKDRFGPNTGHHFETNTDPADGQTLHGHTNHVTIPSHGTYYLASAFDVAHDAGLRTGLWSSKTKFSLYDDSYDGNSGAVDNNPAGGDNGRDKIDHTFINTNSTLMTDNFLSAMGSDPFNFAFVHFLDTDVAGHRHGWMSAPYRDAVDNVDAQLGRIFGLIDSNPTLRGRTSIILTADHGGDAFNHSASMEPLDFNIPFYIWGPDASPGDLYAFNPTSRTSPAFGSNPAYGTVDQPVRNGDLGNLALDLLDVGTIPGSSINKSQDLDSVGAAPTIPAAPTGLDARGTSISTIDITWNDNANNETGYRLERSADGGKTWTFGVNLGAGTRSHQDRNLGSGRTFHYRVRAFNSAGNSAWSNIDNATTLTATAPNAPSNLAASATSTTQIRLTWQDNSNNETAFRIDRSLDGTNFTALATPPPNTRSFTDNNLTPGKRYYYRVRALGGTLGNSPYANVASAVTLSGTITAPAAPSNLSASAASSTRINLSWVDNANNETEFRIQRLNGSTWISVDSVPAGATSYSHTGLSANTRYTYRVRAVNDAGASEPSNTASATTPNVSTDVPVVWTSRTIGGPGLAGSASFSDGVFTVRGSGVDIWSGYDAFHYVYQPLNGDGEIIARVTSLQNTHAFAKAGVMIRQNLRNDSPNAAMLVTPGNGALFQRRLTPAAASTSTARPSVSIPEYMRLVRRGSTVTGYVSNDAKTWTVVGSANIAFTGTVYVGLAVTSHDRNALSTATFSNVSVSGGGIVATAPRVNIFSTRAISPRAMSHDLFTVLA